MPAAVLPARLPTRPRREPWQAPPFTALERGGIALVAEFGAGAVSLALVEPLGWLALPVLPVVVAALVWWVTR